MGWLVHLGEHPLDPQPATYHQVKRLMYIKHCITALYANNVVMTSQEELILKENKMKTERIKVYEDSTGTFYWLEVENPRITNLGITVTSITHEEKVDVVYDPINKLWVLV